MKIKTGQTVQVSGQYKPVGGKTGIRRGDNAAAATKQRVQNTDG
ncbi:MAG: hypothetical protein PHT79_11610 [Syntrophomonadaceae bacterium]|nr:hypothetical protein [Syntrophomonadaceae bacterium]MDD4550392.1 hypothetical protein [Syntrophomonadaceae bacterium]